MGNPPRRMPGGCWFGDEDSNLDSGIQSPLSCRLDDPRTQPPPYMRLGAEAQNRTGDTGIFSPLLYRLSYLGTESGRGDSNPRPSPWQGDVLPLNYTRTRRSTVKYARWTRPDSNRRSPPCKGGAFPTRPRAHIARPGGLAWCRREDSNLHAP